MVLGPGVTFALRMAWRSDRAAPPRTSAVVVTLKTAGTVRDSSGSRLSCLGRREARFGLRPDVAGRRCCSRRWKQDIAMEILLKSQKQVGGRVVRRAPRTEPLPRKEKKSMTR